MPSPSFHFFTLLTNDAQYERMRSSLAHVGFDDEHTIFTVLDNREQNVHEPFSAIGEAVRTAQAPYVVFCHQDLVFHKGPAELVAALGEIEEIDPTWAVAGNAGGTPRCELVFCVDDHMGSHDKGQRPDRVLTLDENFLVIRRDSGLSCSPDLSGFHLYATDLCLNAYLKGRSAYVLEYRLLHTGSSLDYGGLYRQARRFGAAWGRRIGGAVIVTPAMVLFLTGSRRLNQILARGIVTRKLYARPELLHKINRMLRPWRASWLPLR